MIKGLERLSETNLVLYGRVQTAALRQTPPGRRMDYHIGAGGFMGLRRTVYPGRNAFRQQLALITFIDFSGSVPRI